jgi:hypothetical protein
VFALAIRVGPAFSAVGGLFFVLTGPGGPCGPGSLIGSILFLPGILLVVSGWCLSVGALGLALFRRQFAALARATFEAAAVTAAVLAAYIWMAAEIPPSYFVYEFFPAAVAAAFVADGWFTTRRDSGARRGPSDSPIQ